MRYLIKCSIKNCKNPSIFYIQNKERFCTEHKNNYLLALIENKIEEENKKLFYKWINNIFYKHRYSFIQFKLYTEESERIRTLYSEAEELIKKILLKTLDKKKYGSFE